MVFQVVSANLDSPSLQMINAYISYWTCVTYYVLQAHFLPLRWCTEKKTTKYAVGFFCCSQRQHLAIALTALMPFWRKYQNLSTYHPRGQSQHHSLVTGFAQSYTIGTTTWDLLCLKLQSAPQLVNLLFLKLQSAVRSTKTWILERHIQRTSRGGCLGNHHYWWLATLTSGHSIRYFNHSQAIECSALSLLSCCRWCPVRRYLLLPLRLP